MKKLIKINSLLVLTGLLAFQCQKKEAIATYTLTNSTDINRSEVVSLDVAHLKLSSDQTLKVNDAEGNPLGYELVDDMDDGTADRLLVDVSFKPDQEVTISLHPSEEKNYTQKRTQAEISVKKGGEWQGREYLGGDFQNVDSLLVPPEHTDHSWFIRYEGPGWESDLVGYRFYLDWRNGVDIFGKTTNELVLQQVGQDGFDSYHEMADWGMDILKVGPSLGLGAIGRHLNDSLYRFQEVDQVFCEIDQNGKLESRIKTTWTDWTTEAEAVTLTSDLSIRAGSRITKNKITLSEPLKGFCTGLVINPDEEYIQLSKGNYQLIATYGSNSLNNDKLGMAVILEKDQVEKIYDDEYSHVVVFKPAKEVSYSILAAWEKEPDGITSLEEFKSYLEDELTKRAYPIAIQ